jgi:hypothetical protein
VSHPLEHSYNWPTPAAFASLAAVICIGILVRGRVNGVIARACGGGSPVGARCRAYLPADQGLSAGRRVAAEGSALPEVPHDRGRSPSCGVPYTGRAVLPAHGTRSGRGNHGRRRAGGTALIVQHPSTDGWRCGRGLLDASRSLPLRNSWQAKAVSRIGLQPK